ncbi:recombinase family protein [Thalassotalea sp. HSM 43]|uniref:recombinase family protein n=1 Tax=Thalassotalea sp. HSM 43 TaxID=2552945 RepID=UPI00167ABEA4|nr:recombinase family protein [Thalassotalea sp. HSM 43]
MKQKFIIYKRLSTKREIQEHSFEVQDRIIKSYLDTAPDAYIVNSYEEEFSGASIDKRPMLQQAIIDCKRHNAVLLIAKLDRLTRSAKDYHIIADTVDLKSADMPDADNIMLGMRALMSQWELATIRKRISDGVNNAIANGAKCGNRTKRRRTFNREDAQRGVQTVKQNKAARMAHLQPQVKSLYNQGRTMSQVADMLNGLGVPTTGKGKWYATTVKRIIDFDASSVT